jgi:energy-coupling factor transporter ATP-binding protein EcfA2
MLKLKRFRVTEFRSVKDSDWIETDAVTALIGTNESGKTNLLVPLWKLNPAREGQIDPIADFPRSAYNRMRNTQEDVTFIQAEFVTDEQMRAWLAQSTGQPQERFATVIVARQFNGKYVVTFPDAAPARDVDKAPVLHALAATATEIEGDKVYKKEQAMQTAMLAAIRDARIEIEQHAGNKLDVNVFESLASKLGAIPLTDAAQHSTTIPRWQALQAHISEWTTSLTHTSPGEVSGVADYVVEHLPKFVYYSNYGNLDSEIYLPHVIANMKRKDLGAKEQAKARTLRVLFDYVRLSPEEILALGKAATAGTESKTPPTQGAIDEAARRTKEREILLHSAGTELTKSFREWWKQGNYRFRFQADGDHFRIWVSDEKRPEEIELESRSTGLQWFFSFFLTFLVEQQATHKGAILLLDEPGLTLHPLSQRELSEFFDNLSQSNPLLYTTHSPFMVDHDHVDRVRVVYVDDTGATAVSADLRASSGPEAKSVYAVHAALGLSVSDAFLQGCTSVIVEGASDQNYLSGIKSVLIAREKIAPRRELVFVPAGGAKGVNTIAPVVSGKDEQAPVVLLDDDRQGRQFAEQLRKGPVYSGAVERILNLKDFTSMEGCEVEDLLQSYVIVVASRLLRGPADEDFEEVAKPGEPIVPQIEAYAAKHGVELANGWKVDVARQVKQRLLKDADKIQDEVLKGWAELFARFDPAGSRANTQAVARTFVETASPAAPHSD